MKKRILVALILALVVTVIALPGVASAHWVVDTGDGCKTLYPSTFHGDPSAAPGINIAGAATDEHGRNGVDPIVRPSGCD